MAANDTQTRQVTVVELEVWLTQDEMPEWEWGIRLAKAVEDELERIGYHDAWVQCHHAEKIDDKA